MKNPLKVIAVGMFVVAMGFGMNTNLSVSESSGDIDLLTLVEMESVQGESGGNTSGDTNYCACFPDADFSKCTNQECSNQLSIGCSYTYCTDVLTNLGKKPKS